MSEKTYKEQLSVTIDSDIVKRVKELAEKERRSVSSIIELLVAMALEQC